MKSSLPRAAGFESSSGTDSSRTGISTTAPSKKSGPKNSPAKDSRNVTSLLELEDGPSPCASPGGPTMNRSGREAAPASRSATPGRDWVTLIRAIYSRRSAALLRAAALQSSLENRSRASWDVNGSPEFALKWRHWDMPHGGAIIALRASARQTEGNGFSGWPTPTCGDGKNAEDNPRSRNPKSGIGSLGCAARLAGWATPTARDGKDGDCDLSVTPDNGLLGRQALLASNAPTGKRGALNPKFSLWLQGYPETWALSGARAMRSTRG